MKKTFTILTIIILLTGLFCPFIAEMLNQAMGTSISINSFESNFLITVIASVATLAGVFFVIYGWYSVKELPLAIHKAVDEKFRQESETFQKQMASFAEASQKMNAVYQIKDPDQKIDLLMKVLDLYPDMFNARITLAYTYWYEKKDMDRAEEWLEKELQQNPENVNALCDLVALYDDLGEVRGALAKARRAIELDPKAKEYLLGDARLKTELKEQIKQL